MDITTIQALAAIVNSIGLPATLGLIALIAAFNLIPVLADYLRSKVVVNHAQAVSIANGHADNPKLP